MEKATSSENILNIQLDNELKRYLDFLVSIRHIESNEEATLAALRIFKKLSMHQWLPYIYRNSSDRLLIVGHGMFNDILSAVPESQVYDIAKATAINRKVLYSYDPELDLKSIDNWGIILQELEDYGWGKFTRKDREIKAEYLGVPIQFLRGYLESLFGTEFQVHRGKWDELITLSPSGEVKPSES